MTNLKRLSVLVADSDIAQSRRTLDLLGALGVGDVVCVHARDSALQWLSQRAFDVLLCSSKLGADDGLELVRSVRQISPATRSVLIRPHSRAPQPEGIETLERPFSSARLQGLLERAASPLGGLWCEVPELALADILQMYHQGRRSITVLLSGPIAGRIQLVEGEIVHAESGTLEGLTALSRLLEADSGLLRTETTAAAGPSTIVGPFERSMLTAMQLLDERRRDRLNAPLAGVTVSGAPSPPRLPKLEPAVPPEWSEPRAVQPRRRRSLIFALAAGLVAVLIALGMLLQNTIIEPKASPKLEASTHPPESALLGLAPNAAPAAPPSPLVQGVPPEPIPPPKPARATEPTSFVLSIVSTPPRATVTENGKALGKTPLTLTIEKSSVARGPREFRLNHPGHQPHVLRQASSTANVRASVMLSPAPSGPGLVFDADTEFDAPKPGASAPPRAKKQNLDIRMRR